MSIYSNTTPTNILDVQTVTSTITVSGANPFLLDLDLRSFITHTFSADLDITLTSPTGTVVKLTTDNGSQQNNVFNGTFWDDSARELATDHVYQNNVLASPLVSEGHFGAFIGENPNGVWTLSITDDSAGDVGVLSNWSLDLTALPGAPTTTSVQTFTNATPLPIADVATQTSTIAVSGLGSKLLDVDLTTFLRHTFSADLDITLTSPHGTVVTITTDNGAGNND